MDALADAIIEQALQDYKKALELVDDRAVYELEYFFKSRWFECLSDADGEMLIHMIRRMFA